MWADFPGLVVFVTSVPTGGTGDLAASRMSLASFSRSRHGVIGVEVKYSTYSPVAHTRACRARLF